MKSTNELFSVDWGMDTYKEVGKNKARHSRMSIKELLDAIRSEKTRLQKYADTKCFWDMFESFEKVEKMVEEMDV